VPIAVSLVGLPGQGGCARISGLTRWGSLVRRAGMLQSVA
jgi:hypothetical protein